MSAMAMQNAEAYSTVRTPKIRSAADTGMGS